MSILGHSSNTLNKQVEFIHVFVRLLSAARARREEPYKNRFSESSSRLTRTDQNDKNVLFEPLNLL